MRLNSLSLSVDFQVRRGPLAHCGLGLLRWPRLTGPKARDTMSSWKILVSWASQRARVIARCLDAPSRRS